VHDPAVVAHQEGAFRQERHRLPQVGLSHRRYRGGADPVRDIGGQLPVPLPSEQEDPDAVPLPERIRESDEVVLVPGLLRVRGERVDRDEPLAFPDPPLRQEVVREGGLFLRQPRLQVVVHDRDAVRPQDVQEVQHLVLVPAVRDPLRQEEPAPLGVESDPLPRAGEEGDAGAGKRPLEDVRLVVAALPKLRHETGLGEEGPWRPELSAWIVGGS
jgi:hypothetical protein